jgi:hypothetical protein
MPNAILPFVKWFPIQPKHGVFAFIYFCLLKFLEFAIDRFFNYL